MTARIRVCLHHKYPQLNVTHRRKWCTCHVRIFQRVIWHTKHAKLVRQNMQQAYHATVLYLSCFFLSLLPRKYKQIQQYFYDKQFFTKTFSYNLRGKHLLEILKVRATNYGIRSLNFQGPKIWNSLFDENKQPRIPKNSN